MKRLRLETWRAQLLSARTRPCCLQQLNQQSLVGTRQQSSSAPAEPWYGKVQELEDSSPLEDASDYITHPSPSPDAALSSAKLAALHARLSLPKRLPLQTMARTLVDPSADSNTRFNNSSLAQVGHGLISYHVSEWLMCNYPRLPMTVLFAAIYAYMGPKTFQAIAKEWAVSSAAAPGDEVDPGLLQYTKVRPGTPLASNLGGSLRKDDPRWRRGISSRVVYDDEFGDTVPITTELDREQTSDKAHSNFVKAVVGSVYMHVGAQAAKSFIQQHILSRHLDMSTLFQFGQANRDLARLCAREDFEAPVARILSETGRLSRTPVFVVGIFSGQNKLGEGAAPSLKEARLRASVAALKAWYLYSPGQNVRVPSDMEVADARPWEPVHIDVGEIV